MIARSFLDTNVLLYAYDPADPLKRHLATALIERLSGSGGGIISTQVLGEFFSLATRKMGMPVEVAHGRLARFADQFHVAGITTDIVLVAARAVSRYRINFWDAQLWAVARAERVLVLFSEDLQDGAVLDGVHIVNPFRIDLIT
jgi:predicted nucleic acid-binding protein